MLSQFQFYKGGTLKIAKLWSHECKRVFEDRFINIEDINQFKIYMRECISKCMSEEYAEIPFDESSIFTSFIQANKGFDPAYVVAESMQELKNTLESKLAEYNEVKS